MNSDTGLGSLLIGCKTISLTKRQAEWLARMRYEISEGMYIAVECEPDGDGYALTRILPDRHVRYDADFQPTYPNRLCGVSGCREYPDWEVSDIEKLYTFKYILTCHAHKSAAETALPKARKIRSGYRLREHVPVRYDTTDLRVA